MILDVNMNHWSYFNVLTLTLAQQATPICEIEPYFIVTKSTVCTVMSLIILNENILNETLIDMCESPSQ